MNTRQLIATVADRFFYVREGCAWEAVPGFCVYSMKNSARLGRAFTRRGAERMALRLAIGKLRLAKDRPGIRAEILAVLSPVAK